MEDMAPSVNFSWLNTYRAVKDRFKHETPEWISFLENLMGGPSTHDERVFVVVEMIRRSAWVPPDVLLPLLFAQDQDQDQD